MGHYDTKSLPIYQYLHAAGAPNYVIADHFFQAAFGGSFLNHQYLVAARAPIDTCGRTRRRSTPACTPWSTPTGSRTPRYPLYKPDRSGRRTAAHPGLRPDGQPRVAVRRLRGQHDPAGQPAARAVRRRSCR